MKRILITVLIIGAAFQMKAQDDAISKFFEKYEMDDSFTQVTITSRMFGLFTDLEVEDEEDQAVMETISNLESLRILAKEDGVDGKAMYREALNKLPKGEYEVLMTVKSEDENMQFFIKEEGKMISELLLIMGSEDEFFILSLLGNIDLKQVSKMASKMDIEGLDKLEKLDDN